MNRPATLPSWTRSVRELQTAVTAFEQAPRLTPTATTDEALTPSVPSESATLLNGLVRVRAANAGAGASTIALALADACEAGGLRARLLDAAPPAWSGLLGATITEVGVDAGWHRGRRGACTLIDRVHDNIETPAEVPAPRPGEHVDVTILDAGWTARELGQVRDHWLVSAPARVEVLVTRPDRLALSQTESVLAALDHETRAPTVIVVVGASTGRRRSGRDLLHAAGPRVRWAYDHGSVDSAPALSARALPALGPEELPRQLLDAARRLLEHISTAGGPLATDSAVSTHGTELDPRREPEPGHGLRHGPEPDLGHGLDPTRRRDT